MKLDVFAHASRGCRLRTGILSFTVATTAVLTPAPGLAADEGADRNDAVQEVVVTAQKREERLQDVPMSVTALAAESLSQTGATELRDYFSSVPGLNIQPLDGGRLNLTVRGISTGTQGVPTVGTAIDDIPTGTSTYTSGGGFIVPDLNPVDLQRIEVLKGPQGTLYGASSMGGLVKYVTIDPSLSQFQAQLGVGGKETHGDGGYNVNAAASDPLVPGVLGVRASAFVDHEPGYVKYLISDVDNANSITSFGLRLASLWKISDEISLKLAALYQHKHFDASPAIEVTYYTTPRYGDLTNVEIPGSGTATSKLQFYSANLEANLGAGLTLTSLSGYSVADYETFRDYSGFAGSAAKALFGFNGAALDPYAFASRKFSQEVRLASDPTQRLSGFVGLFYTNETSGVTTAINGFNPNTGEWVGAINATFDDVDFNERSAFATATLRVTDQFEIEGGGRYSANNQHLVESLKPAGTVSNGAARDHAFTWSVSPKYTITPDVMAYARVATGYRAGGPNVSTTLGVPKSFGSDTTTNYEIGTKGTFFDRRLTFDLSAYQINWNDIQVTSTTVIQNVTYAFIGNVGNARSRGLELSTQVRPLPHTHIQLNAAYDQAELTQPLTTPGSGLYALKGAPLLNTPKFSGSASVDQDLPLGGDWTPFIGASMEYMDSRFGSFQRGAPGTGNVRQEYPSYTTGDFRVGARNQSWTFTAFVNNVSDSRGIIYSQFQTVPPTLTSRYLANVIRPRTVGVNVDYRL